MGQNAVITGWGFYAPSKVVTNFDLEKGNLELLKKRFVVENYSGK